MKKTLFLAFSLGLLGGCGSTPPMKFYELPDRLIPSAHVSIESIPGFMEREEWTCKPDGKLNDVKAYQLTKKPDDRNPLSSPSDVDLPAGESVFYMFLKRRDFVCSMTFNAQLEAGRHYRLTASFANENFFGPKNCVASLVNTSTGQPVPLYVYKFGYSQRRGDEICRVRMEASLSHADSETDSLPTK